MMFLSLNFQKIWACVFASMFSLLLGGCIVLPIPLFPTDPHKEPLAALAEKDAVTREEILQAWGDPWASAGEYNLIYVADKNSSYVVVATYGGTGSGWGPMTQRDYFVSFFFDESGVMKRVDTYADTGKHDHCFVSGVCFSKKTRNVPLMPKAKDNEAKQFKTSPDKCSVYVYRQPFSNGISYKEYVDLQVAIKVDGDFYPATSFGASVPEGFFRWELEAGYTYNLTADFKAVSDYPFVTHYAQPDRASSSTEFQCRPGKLIYISLTVPRSKKKALIWDYPAPNAAKESITHSRMLAGRYLQQ
jgi:hypothetical protein